MHRLRRKHDIHRLLRDGRRLYAPWVVLYALQRTSDQLPQSLPRVGILLGRGFRSAVSRNRAKRVVREAARVILRECADPWDILFLVRPQALDTPSPGRFETITGLLREAGVLAEKVAQPL